VSRYLNTSKDIVVEAGSNALGQSVEALEDHGFCPFYNSLNFEEDDTYILKINLVDHQLLVSSKIHSIDGKIIAELKDNKLLPPNKFRVFITDKYVEVLDERGFPVLQIDLDKKNNSIIISGLFYRDNSYLLMPRNSPIVVVNYPTRFLRLSEI